VTVQIRNMDAYDLITELRRCRKVAARYAAYDGNAPGVQQAADRHAERAAKLTEVARDRDDPEIGRWLEFYRMTL